MWSASILSGYLAIAAPAPPPLSPEPRLTPSGMVDARRNTAWRPTPPGNSVRPRGRRRVSLRPPPRELGLRGDAVDVAGAELRDPLRHLALHLRALRRRELGEQRRERPRRVARHRPELVRVVRKPREHHPLLADGLVACADERLGERAVLGEVERPGHR